MSLLTIAPTNIPPNQLVRSASKTIPSNITSALAQLTDGAGNVTPLAGSDWLTTQGNVTKWGVQVSTDGGATWNWLESAGPFAFGTLTRGGQMPEINVSSDTIEANAGNLAALAIQVDTAIKLGADITVS